MSRPDYVYVTYIRTAPEKLWQAITDPDIARQYWKGGSGPARVNVSDWKVGSRWDHQRADGTGIVDIVGTVLESAPPRRLVMTWARPGDEDNPARTSRVTFDIEAQSQNLVRLTVTHDDFKDDEKMLSGISNGWPLVLSNLKSLLETGQAL